MENNSQLKNKDLPETTNAPDSIEGLIITFENVVIEINQSLETKDKDTFFCDMQRNEALLNCIGIFRNSQYSYLGESISNLVENLNNDSASTAFAAYDQKTKCLAVSMSKICVFNSFKNTPLSKEELIVERDRLFKILDASVLPKA